MLTEISASLAAYGLIPRGGLIFHDDEGAPNAPSGSPARSVLLVGQAGAEPWPYFRAWLAGQKKELDNPLDQWCREVIDGVARQFGARAVSPSDRPYLPFQQWAMRAEGLKPSPLGILMHPDYGLWHAYRGALLFDAVIPIQEPREVSHLCDLCVGRPCLKSCPVQAHSEAGFAYGECVGHVRSPKGGLCRSAGCLDRMACPHGEAYRYPREVQAFHMSAFVA